MNLQLVADQVNEYASQNRTEDFLAYFDPSDCHLVIMTNEKIVKFSGSFLTKYQKETGPEFIKVLWGRTWQHFTWNVDSNNCVIDSRHIF